MQCVYGVFYVYFTQLHIMIRQSRSCPVNFSVFLFQLFVLIQFWVFVSGLENFGKPTRWENGRSLSRYKDPIETKTSLNWAVLKCQMHWRFSTASHVPKYIFSIILFLEAQMCMKLNSLTQLTGWNDSSARVKEAQREKDFRGKWRDPQTRRLSVWCRESFTETRERQSGNSRPEAGGKWHFHCPILLHRGKERDTDNQAETAEVQSGWQNIQL